MVKHAERGMTLVKEKFLQILRDRRTGYHAGPSGRHQGLLGVGWEAEGGEGSLGKILCCSFYGTEYRRQGVKAEQA